MDELSIPSDASPKASSISRTITILSFSQTVAHYSYQPKKKLLLQGKTRVVNKSTWQA